MTSTKEIARPAGSKLYLLHRIAILVACAAVFYPALSPTRITTQISQYTSLLTSAISWPSLTSGLSRALNRGYLATSTFQLLMVASIVCLVGVILSAVGGCMSAGNTRMKRKGLRFPIIGSLLMLQAWRGSMCPTPRSWRRTTPEHRHISRWASGSISSWPLSSWRPASSSWSAARGLSWSPRWRCWRTITSSCCSCPFWHWPSCSATCPCGAGGTPSLTTRPAER